MVRKAYVPLALNSKELTRIQQDLASYLQEGFNDWPNLLSAESMLVHKRDQRNKSLEALKQYPGKLTELAEGDAKQFEDDFSGMEKDIATLKPDYDVLHAAAAKSMRIDDPSIAEPLGRIKAGENLARIDREEQVQLLRAPRREPDPARRGERAHAAGADDLPWPAAVVARAVHDDLGRDHAAPAPPAPRAPRAGRRR